MENSAVRKSQPRTATKPAPKKRGRKGENISIAFKDIPKINSKASIAFIANKTEPKKAVDFSEYAAQHKLSPNVIIQIKRHDTFKDSGKVYIRKSKETGNLMIWRDPYQESTY